MSFQADQKYPCLRQADEILMQEPPPASRPKKDIGIQKNKKTPFGREVSVI
jgi:hypothetical protein